MKRTGILLVNLGTPHAPTPKAVRAYLKEFLSDPRVVDMPRFIWLPILYGVILTVRPKAVAAKYHMIWDHENNISPLKKTTQLQAEKLQAKQPKNTYVDFAMRYGKPSIAEKLEAFSQKGCTDIFITPLYPQYSHTTTACVEDAVTAWLHTQKSPPSCTIMPPYFEHKAYIDALVHSTEKHLKTLSWKPDMILASFHGLPETSIQKGDPYFDQCHTTTTLLRARLNMDADSLRIVFQSRMGKQPWLQPYTEEMLVRLAKNGAKNIVLIAPGFSADCLETLEELSIRAKNTFIKNGGKHISVVPCLNASDLGIKMLENII